MRDAVYCESCETEVRLCTSSSGARVACECSSRWCDALDVFWKQNLRRRGLSHWKETRPSDYDVQTSKPMYIESKNSERYMTLTFPPWHAHREVEGV